MSESSDDIRVTLHWQQKLIDTTVIAPGGRSILRLPDQSSAQVDYTEEGVRISNDNLSVMLGAQQSASFGSLKVRTDTTTKTPSERMPFSIDATLFNAGLFSLCAHVLLIASFMFSPAADYGAESGGGLALEEVRRYVNVSMSGADKRGRAHFSPKGRKAHESEKLKEFKTQLGSRASSVVRSTQSKKHWSSQAKLNRMVAELNNGDEMGNLRRTLGDINWTAPQAERIKRAGMGGLSSPTDIVEKGNGSALIGLGESQLAKTIASKKKTRRVKNLGKPSVKTEALNEEIKKNTSKQASAALDETTRSLIARAVQERSNTIRACYESFGLAQHDDGEGHLTLKMTLHSDGHLSEIHASIDDKNLRAVTRCVEKRVAEWNLGNLIEGAPQPLSFPYILTPKR